MSDYQSLKQQIEDLKEFLEHRFRENDKAHRAICKKQDYTNHKVKKNTEWRIENYDFIKVLRDERQSTRKEIKKMIIQTVITSFIVGTLVLLGMEQLASQI